MKLAKGSPMYFIRVYDEEGQLGFFKRSHYPDRLIKAMSKVGYDEQGNIYCWYAFGTIETNIPDKIWEKCIFG